MLSDIENIGQFGGSISETQEASEVWSIIDLVVDLIFYLLSILNWKAWVKKRARRYLRVDWSYWNNQMPEIETGKNRKKRKSFVEKINFSFGDLTRLF